MWRDDAYLLDMLLAAHKVQEFTQGVGRKQFENDDLIQNAVSDRFRLLERQPVRFPFNINRNIRRFPGRE